MSNPKAGELWINKEGDKVFFFTDYIDNRLHCIYDDGSGSLDELPDRYEVGNMKYAGWQKVVGNE